MKPYAYGVDIGGTTIKAGLFSREGRLLDRWTLPTRTEGGGAEILPDLARWLRKGPVSMDRLEGVGVGVPGPVGPRRASSTAVSTWAGGDAGGAGAVPASGRPAGAAANDANAPLWGRSGRAPEQVPAACFW